MKHLSTNKMAKNQKSDNLSEAIQPKLHGLNLNKNEAYQKNEKELNAKILEVTMKIRYHFPELSKFLDEIPITIPTGKDREITLNHLREYYESLILILDKIQIDLSKNRRITKASQLDLLSVKQHDQ